MKLIVKDLGRNNNPQCSLLPKGQNEVATVYSHPLSMGSSSNAHYGGNAKTYMDVREAMGKAMVELMKNKEN